MTPSGSRTRRPRSPRRSNAATRKKSRSSPRRRNRITKSITTRDGDGRHAQAARRLSFSSAAATTCRTRVEASSPAFPLRCRRFQKVRRETASAWPSGWLAVKSPHGPRGGQSDLAAPFRHRAGEDRREFRRSGRASIASRAARLARERAGRHGLGYEGDASLDRHQRDVPPGVACECRRSSLATRRTGCSRAGRGSGWRPRSCETMLWRLPACSSSASAGRRSSRISPPGSGKNWPAARARLRTCKTRARTLYRRSLYVYRKRTVPHPIMATFDAPSREICQVKRPRTNTPLQALELLNDVTYVEAARQLAAIAIKQGGASDSRADGVCLPAGTGPLTVKQRTGILAAWPRPIISRSIEPTHAAAQQLIHHGDSPVEPGIDPVVLAAYTATAGVILNLDETITLE